MIPWTKAKGNWREPSTIWCKAVGAWHELGGTVCNGYNDALALVGLPSVDSLDSVLSNSDYCAALAGNAEAYGIMKANYSAEMVEAINSAWNEGLNTLNYKCGFKCWLFRSGSQCAAITGGWSTSNKGYVNDLAIGINSGSSSSSMAYTNNAINGAFGKLYFAISSISGKAKCGIANSKDSDSWKEYVSDSSQTTLSVTFKEGGYPAIRIDSEAPSRYVKVSSVYLE